MIPALAAFEIGAKLIDSLFTTTEEKAEANLKLLSMQQQGGLKELEASMNVIVAEAQSESWVTRSWRPIIMLMFGVIIANNYLLYPYLRLFWPDAPVLDLPPDLWALMKIGLGGYVVGRSTVQGVQAWREE